MRGKKVRQICNRVLTISSLAAPNVWIRNGRSSRDFGHFGDPLGGAVGALPV